MGDNIQEKDRQQVIHDKGFKINSTNLEYGKINTTGKKVLDDVSLILSSLKGSNKKYNSKLQILKALGDNDVKTLREISNYYYRTNGIYFRICNYFAQMYRYDWYIVSEMYSDNYNKEKVKQDFYKALNFLDNS